jgi:glycosyltransferase involved in cell wall biosynthesis
LSVCIITYNEAENLPRCLASVAFADEIVVVDSQSTDDTVHLARQAGCRVIVQPFLGHVAQKNLAVRAATHSWVLCLDADEWLVAGAEPVIRAALAMPQEKVAGYELKRHTFYLGDWVNHGGWWPEYKLRLFDRQRGQWAGVDPHDRVQVRGVVQRLDVEIGHRSYRDIAHHVSKVNAYTTTMAREQYHRGARPVSALTLLWHPLGRFCRMYLLQGGWKEGCRGFIIAVIAAFYVFAKYAKLWEMQHVNRDGCPAPVRHEEAVALAGCDTDANSVPPPEASQNSG